MAVITDPAAIQVLGYAYVGGGSAGVTLTRTDTCQVVVPTFEDMIEWMPSIMGLPGTGGMIEGTRTKQTCIGTGSSGMEVTTYSFALPPMPMP